MKKKSMKQKLAAHITFDTLMVSLEKKLNIDLRLKPDTKVGDFLIQKGYPSLAQMLQE